MLRPFTPFTDDAELSVLARGFLDLSLPKTQWTHAAHFATTLWLLKHRQDLDLPLELPHLIRAFNAAKGGANTDTEGYHETITQASLAATQDFLKRHAGEPLYATCNALMRSALGDPEWLLNYWTRAALFSVAARRQWVAPDIKPLPF
jgi:hypothetical protein